MANHIKRIIEYVILNEETDFLEKLEGYVPNDTDCSEEVERDALRNPEKYDTGVEHLYTAAMLARKQMRRKRG